MSPAKTAETIGMPLAMLNRVDPKNHVLDKGADTSAGMDTFRGVYGPLQRIGFRGIGKKGELCKTGTDLNVLYVLMCFCTRRCLFGVGI